MFRTICKTFNTYQKIINQNWHLQHRGYVASKNRTVVKKTVLISTSWDIYHNLALEEWLYQNFNFSDYNILLLWQSAPCVVIGKHQNPWDEANLCILNEQNIHLARRSSGGGCVYHDLGNLNLTFFTSNTGYNRRYNLEVIAEALKKEFNINIEITPKFDLFCKGKKVSGTASKIGKYNAYHHCTLLLNVQKDQLQNVLEKRQTFINSHATQSRPASTMNLREENPNININSVISAIISQYLQPHPVTDNEYNLNFKEYEKFELVTPSEQYFFGFNKIYDNLASWDWCFGKTPQFKINRTFTIPSQLLSEGVDQDLNIEIVVSNGQIETVHLNAPPSFSLLQENGKNIFDNLQGRRFTDEAIHYVKYCLENANILENKRHFLVDCLHKTVTCS